ncbi:MAG: hypothetical protein II920_01350 [Clostridia bacterium]|nr:hypothetical protein [Clostridia bacterium]
MKKTEAEARRRRLLSSENYKSWGVLISVLALLALLIFNCLSMYLSGNTPPFTREIALKKLFSPAWILLFVLVLLALADRFLSRYSKGRPQPLLPNAAYRLAMLRERAVVNEAALKAEKKARLLYLISGLATALLSARPLLYLLDRSNFASWDLENMIWDTAKHVLPYALAIIALTVLTFYLKDAIDEEEIAALKPSVNIKSEGEQPRKKGALLAVVRIALIVLGAFLTVHGIINGGLRDVFVKAIAICSECIGLG